MEEVIELPCKSWTPIESKLLMERKKRKTYPQDWTNYNCYQTREKILCYKLLNDAIDYIDIPDKQKFGRPRADIKDIIKCMVVKVYNNTSSRRIHSELILFKGLGYIDKVYHYNTLCRYMASGELTPILDQLYKTIAKPMVSLEKFFSIDATGFSTIDKSKWSQVRTQFKYHKDYKKLHAICGVRTNVITSAEVTHGNKADSPYFKPLLEDTAKVFNVKEISADAAYLSHDNCKVSESVGAKPYICIKKNVRLVHNKRSAWNRMLTYWQNNEKSFNTHYHRRSNIESTFSMIKRKYGNCLKGKDEKTKENEILCKVVCHNLGVLTSAMLQHGIKPDFW